MKILFKVLGGLLGTALILAAAAFIQVWYFKPFSIDIFFEKVFLKLALEDPELLSRLRLLEQAGIDFHNDELTDISPQRDLEQARRARDDLATLRSYDRGQLGESRQLSYDILEWFLANAVAGEPWMHHNYPVNQLFGLQSTLPDFMVNVHQVNGAETARDYVARLEKFPAKFSQALAGLQLRESKGILPPQFLVDKVLAEMRAFVQPAPEEHLLYTHLREALGALQELPEPERDAILAGAREAVAEAVLPAYGELIAYFDALDAKVSDNRGVWALPDGDAFYAWCVRSHTTTDLSAEAIHQVGLEEVGRIEAEMDAILRAQGYAKGGVGARMAALAEEPRFLYPDSDAGREQILEDYQAHIDEIGAGLDPYFGLRPAVGVEVQRIPQFKEKTAPGAYYQPAPLDRSRPGVFYANLRDVREIPKFGMRTLAYHEAVPGHHFQLAIAQELRGVPTFRRILPFTVYAEGWALYAERLAKELGYQENPFDDLGRLQAEMFRAVRLVVDTGLHHKRWTREQAIDYMLDKTGQPEADVVAEIERYLVMPGQALAYKVGMMKILELRERARRALGPAFQLSEFHNVVLGAGSMPLAVLETQLARHLDQGTPD